MTGVAAGVTGAAAGVGIGLLGLAVDSIGPVEGRTLILLNWSVILILAHHCSLLLACLIVRIDVVAESGTMRGNCTPGVTLTGGRVVSLGWRP